MSEKVSYGAKNSEIQTQIILTHTFVSTNISGDSNFKVSLVFLKKFLTYHIHIDE